MSGSLLPYFIKDSNKFQKKFSIFTNFNGLLPFCQHVFSNGHKNVQVRSDPDPDPKIRITDLWIHIRIRKKNFRSGTLERFMLIRGRSKLQLNTLQKYLKMFSATFLKTPVIRQNIFERDVENSPVTQSL